MLKIKTGVAVFIIFLALNTGVAISCGKARDQKQSNSKVLTSPYMSTSAGGEDTNNTELKVLGEGFYSPVTTAFVAVARDSETYSALGELGASLPKLGDDFFKSNAVIAAFLGERRTGGYSVKITRAADASVRIDEKAPPKDAFVTQVITTPFKIVAVSVKDDAPLRIAPGEAWQKIMRAPYRLTEGRFKMSGGFAGRVEEFGLAGSVLVMRSGQLVTFAFEIRSIGASRQRSLSDFATGVIQDSGPITIRRLSAGSLIDSPRAGLQASGSFGAGEEKLSLKFTSLPSNIADGYQGEGSIQAERSEVRDQRSEVRNMQRVAAIKEKTKYCTSQLRCHYMDCAGRSVAGDGALDALTSDL